MFEAGGMYAPYDAPRSPSVESGEVMSEEENQVLPEPVVFEKRPSTRSSSTFFTAVLCIRKRLHVRNGVEIAQWFEFRLR